MARKIALALRLSIRSSLRRGKLNALMKQIVAILLAGGCRRKVVVLKGVNSKVYGV